MECHPELAHYVILGMGHTKELHIKLKGQDHSLCCSFLNVGLSLEETSFLSLLLRFPHRHLDIVGIRKCILHYLLSDVILNWVDVKSSNLCLACSIDVALKFPSS